MFSHYPLLCPHRPQVFSQKGPRWPMAGPPPVLTSSVCTRCCFLWRDHQPEVLASQGAVFSGEARASLGRLRAVWSGLLAAVPRTLPQKGAKAAGCPRPRPGLTVGEGAPTSTFFLPLRLGRPLTYLGALGHAVGAGLSWKLAFLRGTSHGTSAEPSRAQGGRSAAAVAEGLA